MICARLAVASALLLALAACASQLQNDVYFDPEARLDTSRSLAFTDGRGGTAANRILAAGEIRTLLEAKGFRFTEEGAADLLVRYDIGRRAKVRISGSSTTGDHAGIVIEVVDPASRRPVWHGLAYETWYDSMDPAAELRRAIASVLKNFPPPM